MASRLGKRVDIKIAMKFKKLITFLSVAALAIGGVQATDLVLLHTNDTHSLIDPDEKGEGGVLQRKAIIDSIRKAEKNVILIDAGDVVQGTLYFKFFKGDVEYPLMNMMDYDIQILGNHEFDNGLEELAKHYKTLKADRLSANYDFTNTPLKGMFDPYVIKKVGGKKIGFIGLNVDPANLIVARNYEGMRFKDIIETANRTAAYLKNDKKCDLVVVVSHVGAKKESNKTTDYELAKASKDIDIIIGGHSHTLIKPNNGTPGYPSIVENAEGHPVMIAQTGKYGKYLGYIKINLDDLAKETPADFDQQLIPVTDRFPASQLDKQMDAFIAPYREKLRAVSEHVIAKCAHDMNSNANTGRYPNWAGDFGQWYGELKADSLRAAGVDIPKVDFALMNVGGIRHDMKAGDVTEGEILETFPFSNFMMLVSIKGSDFIEAMRLAAKRGGEGVSEQIRVVTDDKGNLVRVVVNDEVMDPDKTYLFSTIDYLAGGNDDYVSLANGNILWTDDVEMCAPMMRYVYLLTNLGLEIDGDPRPRFVKEVKL